MAHVTVIVSDAQVEYRVAEGHGCGPQVDVHDRSVEYRVGGMGGAQLWVGSGLADVGLVAGAAFGVGDADRARLLMDGVDPVSGVRLVAPVLRLPEDAKLPGGVLLDFLVVRGLDGAAGSGGSAAGCSQNAAEAWQALERGCRRLGDGYVMDVRTLTSIGRRAGVDLDVVYDPGRVAAAREVAGRERVDVRTRGYDLTLTLPKSFSVAWALAPEAQRQQVADAYLQAALDTVKVAEGWHAKATRGEHGGGKTARVVETSGLLGWVSVDPVNRNGDAHWHAHVTLAAIGRAVDPDAGTDPGTPGSGTAGSGTAGSGTAGSGTAGSGGPAGGPAGAGSSSGGAGGWSALASSGTDSLFGSVHALGGLMEARARALCAERFGWQYRESELTGRLEVAHVPDAAIRATSTRRADVVAAVLAAGLDPASVTAEQDLAAGQAARRRKVEGAEREPAIITRTRLQLEAEGVPTGATPSPGRSPSPDVVLGGAAGVGAAGVGPAGLAVGSGGVGLPRTDVGVGLEVLRPAEAGRRAADGLDPFTWDAQVADVRALLVDAEVGPTAHAGTFTFRQALGLVAERMPGVTGVDGAQLLLAAALDTPEVVAVDARANRSARYTTRALVEAEQAVLAAAARSATVVRQVGDRDALVARAQAAREAGNAKLAGFLERSLDLVGHRRTQNPARAGGVGVMAAAWDVTAAVEAFIVARGYAPSDEQLAVVERVTTGGGTLDVVCGLPGTGKTTVMRLVGDAYAGRRTLTPTRSWDTPGSPGSPGAGGGRPGAGRGGPGAGAGAGVGGGGPVVLGVSVAAVAAENLQAEAGFPATTVAGLLLRGRLPAGVRVLVVDEAGMVDTRDMARLLTLAQGAGVKVVAVGDDRQLPAVGVGGWFAAAHQLTGGLMLTDVRRQSSEVELAALRAYRDGQEMDALAAYAGAGQVVVTNTRAEALAAAAHIWAHHTTTTDVPTTVTTGVTATFVPTTVSSGSGSSGIGLGPGDSSPTGLPSDPAGQLEQSGRPGRSGPAGQAGQVEALGRVERVALLAGRREDAQVLNTLARARARADGRLTGQDVAYRLMGGGTLHLAVGDTVVLRRNEGAGPAALRNGRRAVVEGIDEARTVTVAWPDQAGAVQRAVLTPGDVVAGQVAASYLEADLVQGAAATTVHLAQGRTVDHAVVVVDPGAHAATYVALSRDRHTTTLVLSAEAVADTPEELRRLSGLPEQERGAQVLSAYATRLREAAVTEAEQRQLLTDRWPELTTPTQTTPTQTTPTQTTPTDPTRGSTSRTDRVPSPAPPAPEPQGPAAAAGNMAAVQTPGDRQTTGDAHTVGDRQTERAGPSTQDGPATRDGLATRDGPAGVLVVTPTLAARMVELRQSTAWRVAGTAAWAAQKATAPDAGVDAGVGRGLAAGVGDLHAAAAVLAQRLAEQHARDTRNRQDRWEPDRYSPPDRDVGGFER